MSSYRICKDKVTAEQFYETDLHGRQIVDHAMLNKGTAFPKKEREELGLSGLLPTEVSTIEQQIKRMLIAYAQKGSSLEKHIFLRALQDRNETLFYRLISEHIEEMLPIIYTPTVGEACQKFHEIYRKSRGLFIAYPDKDRIDEILSNIDLPDVKVIVATDGERILGLGDQGAGGMGISIGKISLYSACGGLHPGHCLPIMLDVGTDNQERLNDPLYFGWHHKRIRGKDYEEFIESFVQAVLRKYPKALLQWEDIGKDHAHLLLNRYRDKICSFNDDIQGTAAVVLAGLIAAVKVKKERLCDQVILFQGAGSAGIGIAGLILDEMMNEGLSREEAQKRIWMVDIRGLLVENMEGLFEFQQPFVKRKEHIASWPKKENISLQETVDSLHPTVLIGVSACKGAFSETIVKSMHKHVDRPIILPLSNPSSHVEAEPKDLLRWTKGKAIIATGTPFVDVEIDDKIYRIGQCNNVYIYPGMGLGIMVSGAKRVSDSMIRTAAKALSELSPMLTDSHGSLFPHLHHMEKIAKTIAVSVAMQAVKEGLAEHCTVEKIVERVEAEFWRPHYVGVRCTHSINDLKRKAL